MNECENCGAIVEPQWKFCLKCGNRMPVQETGQADGQHVGHRRFRFDWQLTLGIILALAGVALIVYLVVVLIVPHG